MQRGRRKVKPIVYQYYYDMIEYVQDPYWRDILDKIAKNDLPNFVSIHSTYNVYFSKGAAKHNITLPEESYIAVDILINFLRTYCGIHSPSEQEQSQLTISQKVQEPLTWSNANRHARNHLLVDFLAALKFKMNLSDADIITARRLLYDAKLYSTITPEQFIVQNNKLVAINGLCYENGKFVYYGSSAPTTPKISKSTKKSKEVKDKTWKKFLDTMYHSHNRYLSSEKQMLSRTGIVNPNMLLNTLNSYDSTNDFEEEEEEESEEENSEENSASEGDEASDLDLDTDDF